jgi:hypothetical protein
MQAFVTIDGETYKSNQTDSSATVAADQMFGIVTENVGGLKMELENGDWLVIGKDAVRRAIFVFHK